MQSNSTEANATNMLVVILKNRRKLILIGIAAALLSAIASLLIKEKYKSVVVMFATQQHSFGEQMLEDLKKEDVLAYGEEEDAERLMQIINSEQIKSKIIEKFDLWSVYDIAKTDPGAYALIGKEYNSNVSASLTKFGGIEVEVMDVDPKRAMEMANAIALYTDTVSNRMRSDRARDAFAYADLTLKDQEYQLRLMEDSINVLRGMGIYDYKDQIEALMKDYSSAISKGHPDRAQEIKSEMDRISKYGTVFNKLELDIEAAHEKLNILKKRHELMKIDIDTELPSKFVVDSAVEADKKSYPIRWLIVVMSTFASVLFGLFVILFLDYWSSLKSSGQV
jgi:capsule polysaccharide export protein KpsE/RkpR